MRTIAVTFDYGQTIAELDTAMVASRVAERGGIVSAARLDAESAAAWAAYDDAKHRGLTGYDAWGTFMHTLLERAGTAAPAAAGGDAIRPLVDFLWSEQPRKNLWRRPIAGMRELLDDLLAAGVPMGVVSNSEGKLAELLDEMQLTRYFGFVADSGKLGIEKPDAQIFRVTAAALGVRPEETVHVGDAWAADVEGALGVGARAIWITHAEVTRPLPPAVVACSTAADVRTALAALGVPGAHPSRDG